MDPNLAGQWLQQSFSWDPSALEARPAKAVPARKAAGAAVCQVSAGVRGAPPAPAGASRARVRGDHLTTRVSRARVLPCRLRAVASTSQASETFSGSSGSVVGSRLPLCRALCLPPPASVKLAAQVPPWPPCTLCHAELHARADVVTDTAGRQLRFCQQCTRLEPLINFNAGRRSCKTSLAKRQARAHRGKAHSSPDSSPERGGAPASGLGSSSSEGEGSLNASSGKGSSRRSGGAVLTSKRSRGSPPFSGAASPGLAAMTSNESSRLASPGRYPARLQQGMPAQGQPQPQRLLPLPLQQGPEEMLWSSSLCENDIEELLALDPGGLGWVG